MSCCSGNITQIVRTAATSNCCPTFANGEATLVDADGNTLVLTNFDTADITVAVSLAGSDLTVDVNGQTGTVTLPDDILTSLQFDQASNTLGYTDEEGNVTNIDLSQLAALPAETNTTLVYDAGLMQLTYTGEDGVPQLLDLSGFATETNTSLTFNAGNGTLTYTDETGTANIVDLSGFNESLTSIAFDQNTSTLTYTDEDGANIPIDLSVLENLTTLAYDAALMRLTYTAENGVATIADLSGLNVLTALTYDAASSTLSYRAEDGAVMNIDLSAFNETVTTLIFNPNNFTLTYTNEAGNPANLDLSPLIPVATANTPTVDLAGDGTAATPLTATANISAQANNALQTVADGLFVLQQGVSAIAFNAATGILQFTDQTGANTDLDLSGLMAASTTANSPTIDLTGDGTAATPLQADAVISAQAGNTLQAIADGLFVPAPMVNAALELAGTDLNLRVDGNIVSTVDLRNAATVIINDALGNPIGRALPL